MGMEAYAECIDRAWLRLFIAKKKAAKKWEEEGHKSYNIQALWQRNRDLGIISNIQAQPGPSEALDPGDADANSSYPLSKVLLGCSLSQYKQEVDQEQHTIALKDTTKLIGLVTVQVEKYVERLLYRSERYQLQLLCL